MSKKCTSCGREKEIDQFYRHKTGKDGYMSRCKSCHAKGIPSKVKSTAKTKIINNVRHKECTRCKKMKPLADFHRSNSSMFGVRPRCITCTRELSPPKRSFLAPRTCENEDCRKIYQPVNKRQRFCCAKCKSRQNMRDYKAKNPEYVERQRKASREANKAKKQSAIPVENRKTDCKFYSRCLYNAAQENAAQVGCKKCRRFTKNTPDDFFWPQMSERREHLTHPDF